MTILPAPKQLRCALIAFFISFSLGGTHADEPVLHILIFSGQNNHNWRTTTPKLKAIFENSGHFAVDITEHPEQCDAATIQKYDVLLSNWNTFSILTVTNWPPAMRAAFLDFVWTGRRFVSIHAGSSSFYDWPEYQQLAGGSWKLGQTGHGPPHEFTVKLTDANHPITRGLTYFTSTDELWHRTAVQTNIEILATAYSALEWKGTGKDEPIAFTTRFGQGRCFNLLLGHDIKGMEPVGFQQLLCRGIEWAATGKAWADKK